MSDTIVRLFYVQHDVEGGDGQDINYDLIVIAKDEAQAIELWRNAYYDLNEIERDEAGNITYNGNYIQLDTYPTRVWTIPAEEMLNRTPRVLSWRNMESTDY